MARRRRYRKWVPLTEIELSAYRGLARNWAKDCPECAALAYLQYIRLTRRAPSTTRKKINQYFRIDQLGWVPNAWEKAAEGVRDIADFDEASKEFSRALGLVEEEETEKIHFARIQIEDYPQQVGIWVYLPGCINRGDESTYPPRCSARGWVAFMAGGSGIGAGLEACMFWDTREADLDKHPKFPFEYGMLIRNQRGKYYAYEFTWKQWRENGCEPCVSVPVGETRYRCL